MIRMKSIHLAVAATALLASSLAIGCGGAATPAPTSAPQPAAKPAAAEPTKAPASAPTQAPAAAPTKAAAAAPAPTKEPERAVGFFKDKTIRIILGNSAGRGNDTVLRFVVPYLKAAGEFKDINVENMPGAGGMLGFNSAYSAKPDGLTWGSGNIAGAILGQLAEQEGVQFDVTKWNYLGRTYSNPRTIIAPTKGTAKTVADAVKLGRPINLPIQGVDEDFMGIALTTHFLGLKTKVITGYQGEADIFLACMRGEGDWAGAGVASAMPMIKDGDMVPVVTMWATRIKDLPDTPTTLEVLTDPAAKAPMVAVNNIIELLLSLTLPPGTDAKVVAEARYVVTKALTNPELAKLMPEKTGGREVAYLSGQELQDKVTQVMAESKSLTPVLKTALESLK